LRVEQLVAVGGEIAVASPVAQWMSRRGAETAVDFPSLAGVPLDRTREVSGGVATFNLVK
jgi:hypothetical protein